MNKTNFIGVYDDPDVLVGAIKKVQEKGIKIKNVFSPFPIHEVFHVLGLKTRIPYMTFLYGVIGVLVTYAFLYWISVISYPLKFGGKPLNSLSFVIILFVMTINIATFFTFMTFFVRQKLWPGKKVAMIDPSAVDDKFIISIEKSKDMSAEEASNIMKVLEDAGAVEVSEKEEPEGYKPEEND
ncbi:MAG: DUF3341 domain-containing protein [Bacteroidota bacterium]